MNPLRLFYYVMGILMVVLGLIGAFLPIMPTVPFLLAAAWFFNRSSPRFHNWLYNHKIWGPPIRRWQEKGIISQRSKIFALSGMACGFIVLVLFVKPLWWVSCCVGGVLLMVAFYLLSRPSQ